MTRPFFSTAGRALFLVLFICVSFSFNKKPRQLPRVFVFTDINIDAGDPDDRQSLIHLFWYANEVTIEGIVPDRWNAKGYEACELALNAYQKDYKKLELQRKGYPDPGKIKNVIAADRQDAIKRFSNAASAKGEPLYVLVWGSMEILRDALFQNPALAQNIRVITIGTGLMPDKAIPHIPKDWEKSSPCVQMNWNAGGRNEVYNDARFRKMWWLEINWTYEGMFSGDEPVQLFKQLSTYGHLGEHMKEVVRNEPWAQYFRVGDTPSLLYVLDPDHNRDDPTQSSWAGRFVKPFPEERPDYFTDSTGKVTWDYSDPCKTWANHADALDVAKGTLEERRESMYNALIKKLNRMYMKNTK